MKIRKSKLILDFLNKCLNDKDRDEFEKLLKDDTELQNLLSKIQDKGYIRESLKSQNHFDSEKAWQEILRNDSHLELKKPFTANRLISIAASIAALLILAFFLFDPFEMRPDSENTVYSELISDKAPGRFEAKLILSDSTVLKLFENNDTSISDNTAGVCMKLENWNLRYDELTAYSNSPDNTALADNDCFHTLVAGPRQEFNVTLPDGTVVWLNSSTSIKYSVRPVNNSRRIELDGEAYFEVRKDVDLPFVVTTNKQRVTVTGTSFSITSYKDEDETSTILVDGSVTVEPLLFESEPLTLNPDERATLLKDQIVVDKVNASVLTNWRFNSFTFENESLGKVTSKLSRWYGIGFTFENDSLTDLHFTGVIPKYENIISALELLKLTTNIDFKYSDAETIMVITSSNRKDND